MGLVDHEEATGRRAGPAAAPRTEDWRAAPARSAARRCGPSGHRPSPPTSRRRSWSSRSRRAARRGQPRRSGRASARAAVTRRSSDRPRRPQRPGGGPVDRGLAPARRLDDEHPRAVVDERADGDPLVVAGHARRDRPWRRWSVRDARRWSPPEQCAPDSSPGEVRRPSFGRRWGRCRVPPSARRGSAREAACPASGRS